MIDNECLCLDFAAMCATFVLNQSMCLEGI